MLAGFLPERSNLRRRFGNRGRLNSDRIQENLQIPVNARRSFFVLQKKYNKGETRIIQKSFVFIGRTRTAAAAVRSRPRPKWMEKPAHTLTTYPMRELH